MILDSLAHKALAAGVVLSIGLGLGAWGGYRLGHAAADRAAAAAATQLARDNAAAVTRLRSDAATAVAALQATLDAQRAATARWIAQAATLAQQAAGLRTEIDHVHFTAPAAPAVAGQCPGDPLADPAWRRLYDRAAAAGAPAAAASSARPAAG